MAISGIDIQMLGDAPIFIANGKIVNPLSSTFLRYLKRLDPAHYHENRSSINQIFDDNPNDHYAKQCVIGIDLRDTLNGIRDRKLIICSICFERCATQHINSHLRRDHLITHSFNSHVFITTGYIIPNLKKCSTYFYHKRSELPKIDMTDVSRRFDNSQDTTDQYLNFIKAENYCNQGNEKYLSSNDHQLYVILESTMYRFITKRRVHLYSSLPIFLQMAEKGFFKIDIQEETKRTYSRYSTMFIYTFASMTDDDDDIKAILDHPEDDLVLENAIFNMMKRYVLVGKDDSHKLMVPVYISMMASDDEFMTSPSRAKLLDSVTYMLRLAIADYLEKKGTAILASLDETVFKIYLFNRDKHHGFNKTIPTYLVSELNEERTIILVNQAEYGLSDISKLVSCLIEQYRTQVEKRFLPNYVGVDAFYEIFKKHAVEDMNQYKLGHGVFYLLSKLVDIAEKGLEVFIDHQKEKWDDKRYMKAMYQAISDLNRNIFVCIMMTCGSPYRMTELLTLTFANSVMHRTLHYERGLMRLNIYYNKNTHGSMKYSQYAKYVPEEVGKIIAHYLLIMRYIEVGICWKHKFGESDNNDEEEDEEDEDEVYPNRNRNQNPDDPNNPDPDDNFLDDQPEIRVPKIPFSELLKTRVFVMPFKPRTTNTISKYLKKESRDILKKLYMPRLLRQALTSFTRIFLVTDQFQSLVRLGRVDNLAGHRTEIADAQYGVMHTNDILPSAARSNIDRETSVAWHILLNLARTFPKKDPVNNILELKKILNRDSVLMSEVRRVGQKLYGNFEFYNHNQAFSVVDSINCVDDLMVISPTGSGKSNVYKIPLLVEKRKGLPFITIVICPFISLLEDVKVKMDELKDLSVEMYSPSKTPAHYVNCDVIVIQLEKIESALSLIKYLQSPMINRWLRRVVFDEAHVYIEQKEFREVVNKMETVFDSKIPKLFLSATVERKTENSLKHKFNCFDCEVYRDVTIRKNIEHIVIKKVNSYSSAINQIYSEEVQPNNTRAIVFWNNKAEATALAKKLGCLVFHGDMNPQEKAEIYKQFSEIDDALIVATSAFSHGVDVKRVSHVITIGLIQSIVDFQQVVGRMWRAESDKIGKSYIIPNSIEIIEDVESNTCINKVLSERLDGFSGSCKKLGCTECSICDQTKVIEQLDGIEVDNIEEDQDEEEIEPPIDKWTELRSAGFNLLRYCGLNPRSESIREELGCSSEAFFRCLINIGDAVETDICYSCLFIAPIAKSIDPKHVSRGKECSLRGVIEAIVLVVIYLKGQGALDDLIGSWGIGPEFIKILVNIMEYRQKYKRIFERIQYVPLRVQILVPKSVKLRVTQYLRTRNHNWHEMIYENTGKRCELPEVAIQEMMCHAVSIYTTVNERRGVGDCFSCWGRRNHTLSLVHNQISGGYDHECLKGQVVRILIYAFYEKFLLEEFFREEGIDVKIPTISHLLTHMVKLNPDAMYYNFLMWIIKRYERKHLGIFLEICN